MRVCLAFKVPLISLWALRRQSTKSIMANKERGFLGDVSMCKMLPPPQNHHPQGRSRKVIPHSVHATLLQSEQRSIVAVKNDLGHRSSLVYINCCEETRVQLISHVTERERTLDDSCHSCP